MMESLAKRCFTKILEKTEGRRLKARHKTFFKPKSQIPILNHDQRYCDISDAYFIYFLRRHPTPSNLNCKFEV